MSLLCRLFSCLCIIFCIIVKNGHSQEETNWVDSDVYEFNSGGAWGWFQDERAVIDTVKNKLIVGSATSASSVDIVIFDLQTKTVDDSARFGGLQYSDAHNAPALLIMPNGNYLAMWAHHYDLKHHYSIYSNGNWSEERFVEWDQWGDVSDCKVAYTNLYYLSDENRIYNFSRVFERAPNFIYSDDNGESWNYGSQLTTNSGQTYNKGYYKYWGNGKNRIEMVFTEEHPRDLKTSIYHGYLQSHKTFNSSGECADNDIYSKDKIPTFNEFTKVFEHDTQVNGISMGRCWQHDIARYADGTVAILFQARANDEIDDHRNFYARHNGTEWKVTYIGKAGTSLRGGGQNEDVGLGALNPDDPDRIYISSAFNPGDDMQPPSKHREIWRGTTSDYGGTWEWEPVTANSTIENLRPIVPKWKPGKEALLWYKDVLTSSGRINFEVIGTFYEYEPARVIAPATKSSVGMPSRKPSGDVIINQRSGQVIFQGSSIHKSPLNVSVFSASGKKVFACTMVKGNHTATWNTDSVSTGIYFVRIISGNTRYIKRFSVFGGHADSATH